MGEESMEMTPQADGNQGRRVSILNTIYSVLSVDLFILTPRSGDLGRDVIAIREGFGSVKFIEQVKDYKPGHIVTADEVRALIGVLSSERDATKAVFTTTSGFAPRLSQDKLTKPYIPYRLELLDKDRLIIRLTRKWADLWNSSKSRCSGEDGEAVLAAAPPTLGSPIGR
jgi:hypothetical protein